MNRMSSFDALKKDNPLGNKNFSMSMNNLRINPPKVEKDADISAFYQQLYKSIDKLEKDVMEKRKDMLPEKASILTKRFQSLKSLLEKGGYAPREVIAKKNPWYAFLTKSFKMRQKS